jgi:hypothetical protein
MSLPINPLAKLVSSVSETVGGVTNAAGGFAQNAATELSKINLDQKVSELAGAVGTSLNGFASGGPGAIGEFASAARSQVGGAISTLQQSAGSISNIAADISGGLNKLGIGGDLATGIASLAGNISKAAGQINNLLSLKRGANIPSGAELFKQTGQAITLNPTNSKDWRVRINAEWSLFNSPIFGPLQNTQGVVFPYLPNITFSTKANYQAVEPIHNNYPFQAYKNSQVDEISISGTFTAETELDAAYWIAATTFFKTATKMFFGQGPNVGNPPPICKLSGYGTSIFNNVPVVIKSFSVDLQEGVNYINCNTFGTNTWVPVSSTVTVSVQPIYNRARLRKFSLQDYAQGKQTDGIGFI